MDGLSDMAKYWNINYLANGPVILFFHHYNKLIKASKSEGGTDPYPVKYIGNLESFIKAMSMIMSQLGKTIVKAVIRRG